jgi:hypoxanthine phosphoribosyltransferase
VNQKPAAVVQDLVRPELVRGVGRTVYTEAEIHAKVVELGATISRDYAGLNPIVVGVLKGVIFFMSDLLRTITVPVRADFIAISRYSAQQKVKGAVRLIKDLDETVEGQHVLFVEDVIDTGLTLSYLLRLLRARGPCQSGSLHAVRQAATPPGRYTAALQGVRPARPLRGRLWVGLPRSLPAPALCSRTHP